MGKTHSEQRGRQDVEKNTKRECTTLAHEAAFTSWLLVIKKMNTVADISLDPLRELGYAGELPTSPAV